MDIGSIFELSSWDVVLLALLAVLAFRWWKRRGQDEVQQQHVPVKVDPLPKSDFTVGELLKYNGVDDEHILFAVNGTIFDVTRGKSFYGPGGPYGKLAGHDATRALGTMDANRVSAEWDDHEDLEESEKETARDWESSFRSKYLTVGKLVKTAEEKADYKGELSTVKM